MWFFRLTPEYVSNHLLGLTFCSSAVVKNAKAYVNNLLHNQLAFEREAGSGEIVINQVSKATELDLIGLNGVVHIVDKVLPSDASMTVSSLLQKKNSTIFAKLLLSSEYAEELENLRGVTMFVPTDKALENSIWKAELERDSNALVRNHTLYKFLTNHIVDGIIGSHEFRTNYLKSMAKQDLKMNSILNVSYCDNHVDHITIIYHVFPATASKQWCYTKLRKIYLHRRSKLQSRHS